MGRGPSLRPCNATSGDTFDLDAAIQNSPCSVYEERIRGFMIHQCSSELKWSTTYLARKYSESQALIARLAIHHGLFKLLEREFVSTIEDASTKIFMLSTDPDDRAWFENGHFGLSIAGEKPFHTYIDRGDIELCGRLGSILGLKKYVVRQLALAGGLLFSSSLPDHSMTVMGAELKRFLEWGQERARKAERELRRVEAEAASRPRSITPRIDGIDVFGD